jgi:hypothetical protein
MAHYYYVEEGRKRVVEMVTSTISRPAERAGTTIVVGEYSGTTDSRLWSKFCQSVSKENIEALAIVQHNGNTPAHSFFCCLHSFDLNI